MVWGVPSDVDLPNMLSFVQFFFLRFMMSIIVFLLMSSAGHGHKYELMSEN